MKKLLFILIPVAVVAVAAYFLLRGSGGPETLEVETEPAERMTIVQTVTATGRIQPKTQVNISADVSAKITRLEVDEGDWVDRGALLLELDSERYLAAVESAEANLRVARSEADVTRENMTKAEKDYARSRSLFERELETQAQLDAAQAAFQAETARNQSALDRVEQVRAALKQARDDLSKTRIFAPMAGTISRLNKELGEIALGSQFQEDVILEISNLSGMEALVDVDENDIVSVAIGDAATVEVDAIPDLVLKGSVAEIASSAKLTGQGTTDQKTEFEVAVGIADAAAALRPGMTSTAEIVTDTHDDAVGIPIQCVAVRAPDQLGGGNPGGEESEGSAPQWTPDKDGFVEVVFVVADGVAEARQVETGIQSETHIEILSGIEVGEQVVVGSYRAISRDLRHGSQVRVSGESGGQAE